MKIPQKLNIKIPNKKNIANFVMVVKSIRILTGLGLKEAKDIADQEGETVLHIVNGILDIDFNSASAALAQQGIVVGDKKQEIIDELRELAVQALQIDEDELANEIMQFILLEKLKKNEIKSD